MDLTLQTLIPSEFIQRTMIPERTLYSSDCWVEFRSYSRPFRQPLRTHHGQWLQREGILLRLCDQAGNSGFGEIAPLPWFGSESLEQARQLCAELPKRITQATIATIPSHFPACQFGLETAWDHLLQPQAETGFLASSILLPTGAAALEFCQGFAIQEPQTWKWKIGVLPLATEIELLQQLWQVLPRFSKLRLDANGSLNWEAANVWLQTCDRLRSNSDSDPIVEFLEQPLPIDQFNLLLKLSDRYVTPIALDESVATLEHLQTCYQQGWRGIFVVKPAIVGSPARLQRFCQEQPLDLVFSSVLETPIGQQAGLRLAAKLGCGDRAVGYGVNHWFADDWMTLDFEQLWQRL